MLCRQVLRLVFKDALSRASLRSASSAADVDVLRPMEDFTRRLITASATGGVSYNHRDAAKIWSVIPQADRPTLSPPSLDKSQFLAQNSMSPNPADPLESDSLGDVVERGTFVELRRNRIITHGIVLQLRVLEGRKHAFTLIYTGEIWPHLIGDITYAIPNFVSQDILERSGDGYESLSTAQTTARLQIVEQIRNFTRQHERHFNGISKDVHQLYDKIRHRDPDQWMDITTPEATRFLDVRRPPPVLTLFAMHAHLMALPLYYVADARNHKTTHRFAVRPLSHVQIIHQVDEWVRTRDPAFGSFVQAARNVIKKSREDQETYWDSPPSRSDGRFPPWSPSDLTFIRYMQNALRATRTTQDDPYDRAFPPLVKAIGMYRDVTVVPGLAQLVLTELGVLAPWDDVITRNPDIRLDLAPPGQSREAQVIDELVQHALEEPDKPVTPILQRKLRDVQLQGSTELLQRDSLEVQRHDFGDMPVYIVDDHSAQELDDGISIESVSGEPGKYWIHIHIADPTSVIPPGHVLDLQAMKKAASFYSSHRTWSMLPPALTKPLFSLGANSSDSGQNVLTFSVKVSDDAEFLDYKVRVGLVRNFRILSYAQADSLLGLEHTFRTYPFPKSRPPIIVSKPLPETSHSDMRKLHELSNLFFQSILETKPIINFAFPTATVTFRQPPPINPLLPSHPILWKGHPSMIYTVEHAEQLAYSFRQTVAEWMKLACRAASRFCRDNDIPAIRRISLPMEGTTPADTAHLLSLRNLGGYVDPLECLKHNMYAPPGEPTLSLRGHAGIGIPDGEGYCRVTSPLRRYGDLIMHWQIKHALSGHDRPLFSAEYLEPVMYRLYEQEKIIARAEKMYRKHWALTFLERYIRDQRRKYGPTHEPFPDLLARTTASVGFDTMNITGQVPVVIPSLGVHGELRGVDGHATLPIGTTLAVKIETFKVGMPVVLQLGLA